MNQEVESREIKTNQEEEKSRWIKTNQEKIKTNQEKLRSRIKINPDKSRWIKNQEMYHHNILRGECSIPQDISWETGVKGLVETASAGEWIWAAGVSAFLSRKQTASELLQRWMWMLCTQKESVTADHR